MKKVITAAAVLLAVLIGLASVDWTYIYDLFGGDRIISSGLCIDTAADVIGAIRTRDTSAVEALFLPEAFTEDIDADMPGALEECAGMLPEGEYSVEPIDIRRLSYTDSGRKVEEAEYYAAVRFADENVYLLLYLARIDAGETGITGFRIMPEEDVLRAGLPTHPDRIGKTVTAVLNIAFCLIIFLTLIRVAGDRIIHKPLWIFIVLLSVIIGIAYVQGKLKLSVNGGLHINMGFLSLQNGFALNLPIPLGTILYRMRRARLMERYEAAHRPAQPEEKESE